MTWRHVVGAVFLVMIIFTQLAASPTSSSASPSPCPSPAGNASPSPACDAAAIALLNAVRQQYGAPLADALRTETELEASLQASVFEERQLASLIAATDQKIAVLDVEIQRLQDEIDATKARIEIERGQISALARTMYAQPDSLLLVVMRSQDLRDAVTRTSFYVLAGLKAQEVKTRLADDLKRLQADQDKAKVDREEQERQRLALQSFIQKSQALQLAALSISDQLRTWVDQINAELAVIGGQSPAVAAQLQSRLLAGTTTIVAEARLVTSDHIRLLLQLPEQARPLGARASMQPPPGRGRLAWPLANAVLTQGFGPSSLGIEPAYGVYTHFHTGIDLAAPVNSPVMAAADGVVIVASRDAWGYGNYVVISHGTGLSTLYGHLNLIQVATGQTVAQGARIGLEGSTGISTGPHVHFEVRVGGTPVNPLPYLPPAAA